MDAKQQHYFNRLGFGWTPEHFSNERIKTDLPEIPVRPLDSVDRPMLEGEGLRRSKEMIEKMVLRSVEDTIRLNHSWLQQMADPDVQIREKITLFWHDHFACRSRFAFLAQQQNNTIRKNALGSFRTMLVEVSKDPAMLQFLNNQQNSKDHPNENFARELMELFTLGHGNYTETDVKEAARAFTGWAFNPLTGEFTFRMRIHDFGRKSFRGKTGNFNGDDIIDMLLEDRQTARYITSRLWSFLVSSESADQQLINELADKFYESDYQIKTLLHLITSGPWFYRPEYMCNRIKSPVELLAGIQAHTQGTIGDAASAVFMQRALGQVLFNPPNVGGWPSGEGWIDSSSLTYRLNLPTALINGHRIELNIGDDGDVRNPVNGFKQLNLHLDTDWTGLSEMFKDADQVEQYLLSRPTTDQNRRKISGFASNAPEHKEYIRRLFQGFMSVPEYQLC